LELRDRGFKIQTLGFRAQGSGFRVQGSGFRVQDSGARIQGSGFRRVQEGGHTWLVFKAQRRLYHSNLGSRVMKQKKKHTWYEARDSQSKLPLPCLLPSTAPATPVARAKTEWIACGGPLNVKACMLNEPVHLKDFAHFQDQ